MKRTLTKSRAALVLAPVAIIAASLLIAAAPATPANTKGGSASTTAVINPETIGVANALSEAFRNVAHKVLPAVVAIEHRSDASWQALSPNQLRGGENPLQGTPFEDLFRGQVPSSPRQAPRSQGTSIGSGVIIDSAGVVLTNNHVVAGGGQVIVRTQDGREFEAMEVLTDPRTDIAVVKIKSDSPLPFAEFGNSDLMEVGDWVVALGQPFGLESTVTAGIVSAKNRGIGITDRENFLQTDAAINPGNSGGPLVNLHGEVIGISTAISSRDGGNNGVGFAVPSNLAQWVTKQLVTNGQVTRSYLGVSIQPVDYELSTQLGVAPKSGVVVSNVFPNTPAERSDLRLGDVIVKFGGMPVTTPQQLQLAVEQAPSGKALTVDVIRDGKSIELTYKGELAPSDFGANTSLPATKSEGLKMKSLGLEVTSLTAGIAQQLGLEDQTGVVVTSVQEGSSADTAGLEPGMLIVQVNRQDVSTASQFEQMVDSDRDGSILLLVRTEQGSRFVVVNK